MSIVVTDVVNQEEFAKLEKDFAAQYQTAMQTEAVILKAKLKASVAAHRLGVIANKLQPMVEAVGNGNWGNYLQSHDMAARTVQRAQRIARCMGEDVVAKLTLTQADDKAAEIEAVERGNVSSVDEWRQLKEKLSVAREALEKHESEREKKLADFEKKQEAKLNDEHQGRATELDDSAKKPRQRVKAKVTDKNETALTANKMADSLKAEENEKVSIPEPWTECTMPPEVVAAVSASVPHDRSVTAEEDAQADLLSDEQIDLLGERLHEVIAERPNELTDAIADPQTQSAVDSLLVACNGDAEVAFGVMSIWFANNGL